MAILLSLTLQSSCPQRWHGYFGDQVNYLATHTTQRVVHWRATRFALWHRLHQHIRLRSPLGTGQRVETVHDLNFLHLKTGRKRDRYRQRATCPHSADEGGEAGVNPGRRI